MSGRTPDPEDTNAESVKQQRSSVTEETRADVRRLHGLGLGRNEIAKEIGFSPATVTNICKAEDPPLEFARTQTALAVRARQLDLAEARSDISRMMLVRAKEQLHAMDQPYLAGQFGGKDNIWSEELLAKPPVEVQRNMMTIAAIAVQRHADLVKIDSGRDVEAASSVLEQLASGLTAAALALKAGGGNDPTIPGTDPELKDLNPEGTSDE